MLQEVITAAGVGAGRAVRHSRCACVEKGPAFGDIYSTWLLCKGFLAGGAFLFSSPPLGPINAVHAGAQGVSA